MPVRECWRQRSQRKTRSRDEVEGHELIYLDFTHDSGTQLRYGPGTSSSTTAPSAETTSWTSASSARLTKRLPRAKSALLPGAFATWVLPLPYLVFFLFVCFLLHEVHS